MQFDIGNRKYVVRRRWNLMCDQDKVDGLCDGTNHYIWLDGDVEKSALVGVLRHEHAHAWEMETAAPRTAEERANMTSTIGDTFDEQFHSQGGLNELLRLRIEGYPPQRRPPLATPAYDFKDIMRCGACGTAIPTENIHDGEPMYAESVQFYLMVRGCACPVCHRVQVWNEKCTATGSPLGVTYQPRVLRGEEAEAWRRKNTDLMNEWVA